MINMTKELFEDIQKMKQGQKKDLTNPLFSVAQKIIQSRDEKIEINQAHKANLQQRLRAEMKQKTSIISVLKTMFSIRPQNLITYGSLITITALVILLTGFTSGPELAPAPIKGEPVFETVRMEREVPTGAGGEIEEQPEEPETKNRKVLLVIIAFGILIIGIGTKGLLVKKKKMV